MDWAEFILATFRLVSATVITAAAVYVGWELMVRKVLIPIFVWRYALAILTINAVYRWFVVWVLLEENADVYATVSLWLQPLTQTMASLLVMVILVLTFTHVVRIRAHYSTHHPGGEAFDE